MEIIFHKIEFILPKGLVYLKLCLASTLGLKCPLFYQNNDDSTWYFTCSLFNMLSQQNKNLSKSMFYSHFPLHVISLHNPNVWEAEF